MRISTHQAQQVAINSMIEQQAKLSKVQQQVATGRKIFRPSDDPVAASRIVTLRDTLGTTEQYQDNINAARARLTLEEGVLHSVTDVLQRLRELAIMANNDSQTNESRSFIAEEADQLLEAFLGLANSTDSNGEFLFAGAKSKFKPFTRSERSEFEYHGDDGQRFLQIGPRRSIATSDSGSDTFRRVRDGNGDFTVIDDPGNKGSAVAAPGNMLGDYQQGTFAIVFKQVTPEDPDQLPFMSYGVIDEQGEILIPAGQRYVRGAPIEFSGVATLVEGEPADGDFFVVRPSLNQDAFTTILRFVDALRVPRSAAAGRAKLHNEINRTLVGIDHALGNILSVRANVGARLNALDGQEDINGAYQLQIRQILSNVEDLDYAEAVSDLNLKLTGLEASQKAFTRVQGISLFNFI